MAKASDYGRNDRSFLTKTHLGHLLHIGDSVLGYDLATANFASDEWDALAAKGNPLPDVILVRGLQAFFSLGKIPRSGDEGHANAGAQELRGEAAAASGEGPPEGLEA